MEKSISWGKLLDHYKNDIQKQHLRELLKDDKRNDALRIQWEDILFDFTHQKLTEESIQMLIEVAHSLNLPQKIEAMFSGVKSFKSFSYLI